MTSALLEIRQIIAKLLLVILDFDRTLFDTSAYYADFLEWIAEAHGPAVAEDTRKAETAGEFDIFNFLEIQHDLPPDQIQYEMHQFISRKYRGTNHTYLLPGAASLIRFLRRYPEVFYPVITTTGSTFHQSFKLGLCPELNGLPVRIISGNKGQMVQDDLNSLGAVYFDGMLFASFVLVDDKSINLCAVDPAPESPDRYQMLFHVVRKDGKDSSPTGRDDITRVRGLTPVERALRLHLRSLA